MATRQNNGVFDHSEADNALSLSFITLSCGCGCVLLTVHVCQVENCFAIQNFLLDELKLERIVSIDGKRTARKLDRFFRLDNVVLWEDGLNSNHNRKEVFSVMCEVMHLILSKIKSTNVLGELLTETCAELEGIGRSILLCVGIIAETGTIFVKKGSPLTKLALVTHF